MAEQAYAYVTLIPVAKGFQSAVAKELGGTKGVGKTAGQETGKNFSEGFKLPLKSIAVAVGGALATLGVGKFFKDSIVEASDLDESINAVNKSYLQYADDVLALGADVASRLGLSTVDFNAAAVRFSAFAERVVGEGGDVAGFVDDISTRAADFASVFNIEVSEALQVFQSGLSGEAEPLKRFGINLLDSEVKAYAYRAGIAAIGDELTETEKVQARYGLLMEATNKTAGDFADTSDGLANSQRILQANFENLQAQIGKDLTPSVANFVTGLKDLALMVMPGVADFVSERLAPVIENLSWEFRGFIESASLDGWAQATTWYLEQAKAKFEEVFGGGGLIDLVEKGFSSLSELRMKLFDAIMEALPGILDAFAEFLPQLIDFFLNTMLPQMLEQMTSIVGQLVDLAAEILPKILTTLLEAIPDLIDGAFLFFNAIVDTFIEILPDIIATFKEMFPKILTAIIDAIPQLLDGAVDLFLALIDGLLEATPDILDAVIELVPKIAQSLIDNLPKLVTAAIELMTGIATAIIENGPRIIGGALKSIWDNAIAGLGIGGSGGGMSGGVSGTTTSTRTGNAMTSAGAVPANTSAATFTPRPQTRPSSGPPTPSLVYNAAPNKSLDSEAELYRAMQRARAIGLQ